MSASDHIREIDASTNPGWTEERIRGHRVTVISPRPRTGRPVIVFRHGGFHGAWFWSHWMRQFTSEGWPCAAIEAPHARGPVRTVDQADVRSYARCVADVADAFGDTVLVGHSLGGLVCLVASTMSRPHAMVLVAPSPAADLGEPTEQPVDETEGRRVEPPDLHEVQRRWFARPLHAALGTPQAFRARLAPEAPRALNDVYLRRVSADAPTCPVLVVGGARDRRHLSHGTDRRMAEHCGADYLLFDGHGHNLVVEEGNEVARAMIATWLDQRTRINAH